MNHTKTILRSKFCLRTTLVVPFVLQIATAVGLVGYLSFRNGQRAVDDLANQLIEETGARIEQHVLDYLRKPQTIVQMTHAALQSGNLDLNDLDGLRRYFWQVVSQEKLDNYLYLGTEKSEFIGVERMDDHTVWFKVRTLNSSPNRETYLLDDRGNPQKLLRSRGYDPRSRPWYQEGIKIRQFGWSPVFPSYSRKNTSLEISPIRPVFNADGQVLAVVSMNLRLVRITDFLQDLYTSHHGQSFIMERSGDLIASSALAEPFTIIGEGGDREIERLPATNAQDPTVSETARFLQQQFGSFAAIADDRQLKMTIGDALYYIQVLPIRDGRGIDWLTVVVVPEQDFMAQINQNTRNTILLCLAALGTAIASSILTARWISRPILGISQASDQLAQGDLDQQVEPSLIVEIDTLANSFNTMAGQLKESFNALQQSEERFRSLVANIPGAIYRCQCNSDWKMKFISNTITEISGYQPSDYIHNRVCRYASTIHPEDRALVDTIVNQAVTAKKPYEVEYKIIHKDGSIRWVAERGRGVFDPQGNLLYLDGAIFDVSERKKVELALAEKDALMQLVLDNIPQLIFWKNSHFVFQGCNRQWAKSVGLNSPDDIVGKTDKELYQDESNVDVYLDKDRRVIETGNPELYLEYKSNKDKWFDTKKLPIRNPEHKIIGILGTIEDITERKKAEEALRIAEENYRSIFENAVEGIFQSSPEGRFISVNPALARIYGYDSPREMIESITNISEQLYVDSEKRTEFKKLLETYNIIKDFEFRCYYKDGSIIWTQINARAVKANSGNILYYEGIVQDITERKRREDELRRQLEELQIEIDQNKREKEVAMLTESSYFQEVQQEIAEVDLDEFWS